MRSAAEIAAELPPDAWRALKLREGAKGPLVFEFAVLRVWAMRHNLPGPPIWLVLRRSLDKTPEVKYYVSNAGVETPWQQLAMVTGTRIRVEEYFEDGKMHLGMADYKARAWSSWHHHMALVALAHLYVTLTRRDLKKDIPELTLDMAFACCVRPSPAPNSTPKRQLIWLSIISNETAPPTSRIASHGCKSTNVSNQKSCCRTKSALTPAEGYD